MKLTPLEVVTALRESEIYIGSTGDIDDNIRYALDSLTSRLEQTLDLLKSLPSDNTKSIINVREVLYLVIYEREAVSKALEEQLIIMKMHNLI